MTLLHTVIKMKPKLIKTTTHSRIFSLTPTRPHRCMSSFQSYSTFSSENLSVSDGEEGNTSDHSHSGPLSASQEEHLDELLSHTPDIPIDISTQSDGLSDKECAVRRVKTQISLGKLCSDEHSYEVSSDLAFDLKV